MKLIDVSNHDPVAIYPGSKEFKLNTNILDNNVTSSWVELDLHHGTHIDSPMHHYLDGVSVDVFPTDLMCGKCQIIDVPVNTNVTEDFLEDIDIMEKIIFFRFKSNSMDKVFDKDFNAVDMSGAKYLVKNGIDIIGTNYLSIESYHSDGSVHKELLKKPMWIIEGLDLSQVEVEVCEYICTPLKLKSEASPVRVMLKI